MQVKIIIGDDGTMFIAADNQEGVSYEEAEAKLAGLKAKLGDLPIQWVGGIERHVHPDDHQHAHTHQHQHAH